MTQGLVIATFAFVSVGFSQSLPSYQWIQELDASSLDSVAGVQTDTQGNTYIVGSTLSQSFPVKNAAQANNASAGLYRFSGMGWTPLGLSSCSYLALDPQNPSTIYAVSNYVLMKSTNGGVTFAATTLPSSTVFSVAIQPGNDQIVYAGTDDEGVFRSTDGGATWTQIATQDSYLVGVQNLWIDPTNVSVIFAEASGDLLRSADAGASFQPTTFVNNYLYGISFDTSHAGVLYVSTTGSGIWKSTDDGQTFTQLNQPAAIYDVLADPFQAGRLIGFGNGLFQSTDEGSTWTQESSTPVNNLAADTTITGVYYADIPGSGIVRISNSLQTLTPIGGAALPTSNLTALAVLNGQVYEANAGSTDIFVAKLDPSGNIVYATYLGGTGSDQAVAMTVDASGNVFVTGTTGSADFPVSNGAYATSGTMFVSRLNPDGSLAYSTYFRGTDPLAIATDGSGSAWLLGNSGGELPVTPGALATTFTNALLGGISIGPPEYPEEATLTRFSATGSSLTFSTYVAGSSTVLPLGFGNLGGALVVAGDGSAYVGGMMGIFHIDATGSTMLSSMMGPPVTPAAMALGADGSVYAAGEPGNFPATAGVFQTVGSPIPSLPYQPGPNPQAGIVRIDPTLKNILAATYFGVYAAVKAMTMDAAGNVYIGGSTASTYLPTRTPFNGGFAYPTGFMSELSGDLSSLVFSSYFGDTENFTVSGVGIGANGSVVIGGATHQTAEYPPNAGNVWLNSLSLTPPPALRIDSVENAASFVDLPLAAGETIVVNGAGFGSNAQLTIGGAAVVPLSITPTTITAVVPAGVPAAAAAVEVQSGGASTNSVLMPVAATAPGIFTQNGTGYGQGYILNKDGSMNSPSNPAAFGDPVTIFATGVGPLSFTQCCAVAQYPVSVYIDSIYCDGAYAIAGPVSGLPGNVYQITVFVPDPAVVFANTDPGFTFPPLDGIQLNVNGVMSQAGVAISIAP